MKSSAIETYTGRYFDYYNPRACDVKLEDIARALSLSCRFGGHVSKFYSVAEHACLVYRLVREGGASAEVCYAALHHDSHEAYLGDVPTPLKRTFGTSWRRMETRVDEAIAEALGIEYGLLRSWDIKEADGCALMIEAAYLKLSQGVGEHWGNTTPVAGPGWAKPAGLQPGRAEEAFLYWHRCAKANLPVVVSEW